MVLDKSQLLIHTQMICLQFLKNMIFIFFIIAQKRKLLPT